MKQKSGLKQRYLTRGSSLLLGLLGWNCVLLSIAAATEIPMPRLVSDESAYHFGNAYSETEVEHTFILRNEGDAPLTIHRIHSSCGCTVADLKSTTIPSWGEELLTAKVSLKNRHGPQRVSINVHSNDPSNPIYRLTIEGHAIRDFQVRPSLLSFGMAPPGTTVTRTLDLLSDEVSFKLQDIASSVPGLGLRVTEIRPGHHYRLVTTLSEENDLGVIEGTLRIRTDHPRRPEITVPFTARITAQRLIVSPEALTLQGSWEGPLTRQLVIRSMAGTPFNIEQIDLPHADIEVRQFPVGTSGYRLQLVNLRSSQILDGAKITITTDLADQGALVIPIRRTGIEATAPIAGAEHE